MHTSEIELATALDAAIAEHAAAHDRVVVSADTDFGYDLESGAIVVLEDERVRIRSLPLR